MGLNSLPPDLHLPQRLLPVGSVFDLLGGGLLFVFIHDAIMPERKQGGNMSQQIQFLATLAGVNTSARPLSFGIDGDAKISFETDATQKLAVVSLLALDQTRLRITVEVDENAPPVEVKTRGRKKKPVSTDPELEAAPEVTVVEGEFSEQQALGSGV